MQAISCHQKLDKRKITKTEYLDNKSNILVEIKKHLIFLNIKKYGTECFKYSFFILPNLT